MKILLTAPPRTGKSTVLAAVLTSLDSAGIRYTGFYTEEVRNDTDRIGFDLVLLPSRERVLLARREDGTPRVGSYRVDVDALDRCVEVLRAPAELVIIDEIGRMQLLSVALAEEIESVLSSERPTLGTIHVFEDQRTDAMKVLREVTVVEVTAENRDALPATLFREILAALLAHR